MIKLKELNPHNYPMDLAISNNLLELQRRLNQIRTAYGKPMIVTSGLRSRADQDALLAAGKSTAKRSLHLTGQAADIADDGTLKDWIKKEIKFVEHVGLWMEDFSATPSWIHFQTTPPRSGNRFFLP